MVCRPLTVRLAHSRPECSQALPRTLQSELSTTSICGVVCSDSSWRWSCFSTWFASASDSTERFCNVDVGCQLLMKRRKSQSPIIPFISRNPIDGYRKPGNAIDRKEATALVRSQREQVPRTFAGLRWKRRLQDDLLPSRSASALPSLVNSWWLNRASRRIIRPDVTRTSRISFTFASDTVESHNCNATISVSGVQGTCGRDGDDVLPLRGDSSVRRAGPAGRRDEEVQVALVTAHTQIQSNPLYYCALSSMSTNQGSSVLGRCRFRIRSQTYPSTAT